MGGAHSRQASLPLIIGIIVLVCASLLSISFGTANISLSDTVKVLIFGDQATDVSRSYIYIIQSIRIPRVITAVIVGMALAASGVVFQSLFRNPMAEPFILGVSSGAAFGVAFAALVGAFVLVPGSWGIPLFAFIGGIGASTVIYLLSGGMRSTSVTLLLSGVAMNFLLSAMMSLSMYFNREQLEDIIFWTMGSFSSASWEKLLFISPVMVIGLIILLFYHREMDLLLLGDEAARSMGLSIKRTRVILLVISTLLTASAVAISGVIGFVGLVTPHIMRMIVGPSHKRLLPLAVILGGLFTLVADTIARGVLENSEIPVGIITSMTGAPFFIYLLRSQKKEVF